MAVCVVSLLGSSTLLGRLCLAERAAAAAKKVQQQLQQLASSCPLDASLAAGKGGEQTELKLIAFIASLPLLPSSFVRSMNLGNIISTFIENTYSTESKRGREGRVNRKEREREERVQPRVFPLPLRPTAHDDDTVHTPRSPHSPLHSPPNTNFYSNFYFDLRQLRADVAHYLSCVGRRRLETMTY